MDIKTLKEQKIDEELQSVLIGDESMMEIIKPGEENTLEMYRESRRKRFVEQCQRKQEESKSATAQQIMKNTSRLIEQQLKRLERERLEEEKRQKAKDEFMERYHAEQKKDRSDGAEKLLKIEESDLQWNSSAVKESEELFLQIMREWGMNY